MEEQINSIEQLKEYYPDGKFDWPEIIQNFKLTKKFMNDNIVNLDTILLFENQELDLEFIVQNIIYFNINDIEKYLNIKDPSMIVSLQAKKDEAINKSKEIEKKVKVVEERKQEVSITNSLTKKEEVKVKKPQTLAIIEQLALTRLKELNVDHTTIVGDYLLNSYIDKYNDLKMKYEFSISKFDFLILDSLDAKAH